MKHFFIYSALAALSLTATAAVPFQKGIHPLNKSARKPVTSIFRAAQASEVLNEDFSKFSDGTEENPGAEIEYQNGYHIPEKYTAMPGWTGQSVRPAGGAVNISQFEDEYGDPSAGYISTPKLNLGGTATLTFRARALGDEAFLWVSLCDDDYGPGDDQGDYILSSEWQEFTLVATNGSLEMPSYFQFYCEGGSILIDDVRILFKADRIATPYANAARNISPNSFLASWEEVPMAEKYLLNVICVESPVNPKSGELVEYFDGINVNGTSIDTTDPNYPEGWVIDVSSNGSQDIAEQNQTITAPVTLLFDAVGDMMESPAVPYPLDDIRFWIAPSAYEDDYSSMSLLRVDIYHSMTDSWETIAQIPYFYLQEGGSFYGFDKDALGDDSTRVRFSIIQKGNVNFAIDNVTLHYTERGETTNLLKDFEVKECQYLVENIEPRNEYTYYVQAAAGDLISAASYPRWVDGIVGLAPQTNEATEVTEDSFTASWNQLGHATNYAVASYRILEPSTDLYDVVVLEENFDRINEGTVENPGMDWTSPFDFSSRGWTDTAWGATQPAWAKGMAGTTGTNLWMGVAGLVYTPVLDLSCYDGKGIKVDATVVTTVDSFEFGGATEPEGIYAMILRSPSDTQPIASGYFEAATIGSTTGTAFINNVPEGADLSNVIIAFMNKSGLAFFVDDAKVTMNVPAGKRLMAPYKSTQTPETRLKFQNLEKGCDYGYSVTASTTRNYENYVSKPSEIRVVRTSAAGVETITGPLAGLRVTAEGNQLVIEGTGDWSVVTPAGVVVANGSGNSSLNLPKGLYIVATAEGSRKIIL